MKYFREYPWGFQALLFLLMTFTMMSAATVFMYTLLPKLSGYTLQQLMNVTEHSPATLINTSIIVQGLGSVFIFLLPSFIYAYLSHPNPAGYLGLRAPGKSAQLLLSVALMLGAMPALSWIAELIGHINFGAKVKADQAVNDNIMKAYLSIPNVGALIKAVIVLAIIPAVGEELFFRGVLMRLARKRTRNIVIPVVFTAAVFAYSHTNIYGYLSIFLAGALLAVIYNLTGSIWCSIAAHMFFNGTQVVMAYLSNGTQQKHVVATDTVSLSLVAGGLVVFAISFYLLMRNKTPLPEDWANDFAKNEIRYAEPE